MYPAFRGFSLQFPLYLIAAIYNPYLKYTLVRNPNYKYAGKLVSVDDFLAIANNSTTLSGVIIKIENAAYLAQKQGMSVTDAVTKALDKAGYSNQTTKRVTIQSTNSSVLETFRGKGYERVYEIEDTIRDAENSTIADIKSFADAVIVSKSSIFPATRAFTTGQTNIIDKFHAFNLSVFAQVFRNEFVSQAWDFYSDINLEMTSFVAAGIDGVITEFPQTAAAYRKNRCLKRGDNRPPYMLPVLAGSLLSVVSPDLMPPAEAPAEVLSDADVSEPPLPGVVPVAPPGSTPIAPSPKASDSDGHRAASALSYLAMAMIGSTVLLLC